jgi:uncharacterized membrane protein
MDLYTIFKFLHVLCAIGWVGGGLTLLAASVAATRASDNDGLFAVLGVMNRLGKTWFMPASFLTVVFGAITATFGGMWGDLWVVLGLAGFASTFLTGLLLLEPTGRKIGAMLAADETEQAAAAGRRLMNISKFDYTVMLVVIGDMVLKPSFTDFVIIAVMAAAVIAGATLFLGPLSQRTPAAQASA